ncbi:MAG TPA: hypothetical protein VE079_15980 [Ensifer sp.]|nr:hypothetical protein [Ensifer sp.]
MKVFNYDKATGIFSGVSDAQESPLEPGKFLIPAHATEIAPPPAKEGFSIVFSNDAWGYLAQAGEQAEPTPEPVYSEAMVRAEGARRLALIAAPYSPEERETWSQQVMEAKAIQADANADAPLLTLLAAADGVPVAAMAATVLAKAEAFAAAAGAVLAAQRALLAMDPIPADYAADARWLAE